MTVFIRRAPVEDNTALEWIRTVAAMLYIYGFLACNAGAIVIIRNLPTKWQNTHVAAKRGLIYQRLVFIPTLVCRAE